MSTVQPMYEWKAIPWRKLERKVFKLQRQIYQASQRGDVKAVHKLQRLLMKSWSAKCLSVRKVTQDNQGKKTAGVDGIKSLTPQQRLLLVSQLEVKQRAKPTRRVWIPKPGKDEKRPLGIPTMHDRAHQALVKLALEPEWEAKFEPNSYGFRPGRSCHDAIEAIHVSICHQPKYVLDADIAQCFDKINHEALLAKVGTFPLIRHALKAWLKSGVMDNGKLFPTQEGTPQGGVISPLLANIALHGLETKIRASFPASPRQDGAGRKLEKRIYKSWKPEVIRYADDFVVLHRDPHVIQKCKEIAENWLKDMGLELKPSKTRITHTLETVDGKSGFEFLGFEIRQFQVGKYKSRSGFKRIIKPSKDAVKRHLAKLTETLERCRTAPQSALIDHLNPVIRGWANYYSTVNSKETYKELDHLLWEKLYYSWARRRCGSKTNRTDRASKYWEVNRGGGWVFKASDKSILLTHAGTPIVRHVKVKGEASPFDGNWTYWTRRRGKYPTLHKKVAMLLKKQGGKCTHCGLYFRDDDLHEVHHKDGNHRNNKTENLELLHRHCHDTKHGTPLTIGQAVEEPCEGKLSCTVLK